MTDNVFNQTDLPSISASKQKSMPLPRAPPVLQRHSADAIQNTQKTVGKPILRSVSEVSVFIRLWTIFLELTGPSV